MGATIKRPPTTHRPSAGLLWAEHFQIAYVTSDLERARSLFRDHYGISAFTSLDALTSAGGAIHVDLAWVGGTMIELIKADGPGTEFYTDRLLADDSFVKHHHLGYLIHDLGAWDDLMASIKEKDWAITFEGYTPGFMRFCYVEAEGLGHFLEFILLEDGGVTFFENVTAY